MPRICNDITETIGNTPLVRLNRTSKKHGVLAEILLTAWPFADITADSDMNRLHPYLQKLTIWPFNEARRN